jgi:hypothetical protein
VLTHAKYASAGGRNKCSEREFLIRGHIPFAGLAVMCARWFVSSAHAAKPWSTRQLLYLISLCVVEFWFLSELAWAKNPPLREEHDAPNSAEQLPDLL